MFSIPGLIGRLIATWFERRRIAHRVARREAGESVPVPVSLRRTYGSDPNAHRPWLPGTLTLDDAGPVWTGSPDVIDLEITLDRAIWRQVGRRSLTPDALLVERPEVIVLEADHDTFELAVSEAEAPLVARLFT